MAKKNKTTNQGNSFTNQKQLRIGKDQEHISRLAGDKSADNRIDVDDSEANINFRKSMPAGTPFMHPMHDATADPQLDQKQSGNKHTKNQHE